MQLQKALRGGKKVYEKLLKATKNHLQQRKLMSTDNGKAINLHISQSCSVLTARVKKNHYRNYLRNPSKLSNPFCALNLFGSYSWIRSFARAGFAYG